MLPLISCPGHGIGAELLRIAGVAEHALTIKSLADATALHAT